MMAALSRVGLVPDGRAGANGIDALRASGVQFSVFDVDTALKEKTTLNVQQRLQFKLTLDRAGLLKSDR